MALCPESLRRKLPLSLLVRRARIGAPASQNSSILHEHRLASEFSFNYLENQLNGELWG